MGRSKIFYLITSLNIGGAELMLKKIISRLNKKKFDIAVCCLTNTPFLVNEIKKITKKIYILNLKNLLSVFTEFIKLRRIIKRENPNILHCFMIHSNLFGRFASIGLKCKVISSTRVKLIDKKHLIILDKLTQRFVDYYIVNSNSLKQYATDNGIDRNKIFILHNGIDFSELKMSRDPLELKRELNIKDSIVITMIANLRKQKDYPTVLKALSYLERKKNITFLSCGSGTIFEDKTKNIKSLTAQLNLKNVKFLGYRNDIPDILAITDIWVSTTLYEGQSNSLLEAMAMKKPIVTTNIPENSEVVRNEKEALLVPIRSPLKTAKAIKMLIENKDLANRLANNAYQKVCHNYDINMIVDRLERFYRLIFVDK